MTDVEATIASRRRFPAIWLVPIVALVLGIWMVVYTFTTEGPQITIRFSTAEGIQADKTKVRARSVEIGLVESVSLNEDLESVSVVARLDKKATPLLRDDTRFWVVRPRVGARGISGLATIMSGAYITLEPGSGAPSARREFLGLDEVPATPVGTPGLRLTLLSRGAGSVGVGNPVLYRGFPVGTVEETVFDPETGHVRHSVFIEAPNDALVNEATRFWDTSGISVRTSAEGIEVDIGSLESLVAGGVSFDVPEGKTRLGPVESGTEFVLYEDYQKTTEESYQHSVLYVVEFAQSVRGLAEGAPVEYRGVRVGSVRGILLEELVQEADRSSNRPIPVLISLEPGRMRLGDTPEAAARLEASIGQDVAAGARASLQSGSLLTGRLFVALDYYPGEAAGEMGTFAGYPTLPTRPGGFQRIERQISRLVARLNDLPLDATLRELNGVLAEVRSVVGSDEFQELPASLTATLDGMTTTLKSFSTDSSPDAQLNRTITELNRTLQAAESLLRTVEEKPNSLIFSKPIQPDPEPRSEP